MSRLRQYLKDPFLKSLYEEIRAAGPIRSISLDITAKCNLRCAGCYYFAEGMDQFTAGNDEEAFNRFIESEKQRGTTFVTIVGGEPALSRLQRRFQDIPALIQQRLQPGKAA